MQKQYDVVPKAGALDQREQETIAAVVKAYAGGRIELTQPNGKTSHNQLRHAPSYATRSNGSHPYTKETVADFLRWPVTKIERALTASGSANRPDSRRRRPCGARS